MKLMTAHEAAERLRILHRDGTPNPKGAKRYLAKLGVEPYPLGAGGGLGNRYDWHEIEDALRRLRRPAQQQPRRARKDNPLAGMSATEFAMSMKRTRRVQ